MFRSIHRSVTAIVLAAGCAAALTACAPAAAPAASPTASGDASAAPAPTVTVTATVTATPEPPAPVVPAPGDALSALEAWSVCVAVSQVNDVTPDFWAPVEYTADAVVDQGGGSFQVKPGFSPTAGQGAGAQTTCIVSGTLAAPMVDYQGAVDFG
jgi:ABC-type enterochelin transport system substrate-binding protein